MKNFRRIYLITLGVLSITMGIIAIYTIDDFWAEVVLLGGMVAGGLAMFLIAAIEANPCGVYMRYSRKDHTKSIRIL
jgi:hypothetical protein